MADTWRGRGIALVRAVGFLVVSLLLAVALVALFSKVLGHKIVNTAPGTFSAFTVVGEWLSFAVVLAATGIMARLARRPFGDYGLGGARSVSAFAVGLGAGIAMLAVQLLLAWMAGAFSFGSISALSWQLLLADGALYAAFFLAVALFEEMSCRGILLVELSRAISFWPAAILLGAGFGSLHLLNGNLETVFGALSAGAFGVLFAVLFRWTGSLWLSIGLHGGWDYAESYLFGVPNSGLALRGGLLVPASHGPVWLTGGSVGPEASVLVLISFVGMLALGLRWAKAKRTNTASPPAH